MLLILAVKNVDLQAVRQVLYNIQWQGGNLLNVTDGNGWTALHWAAEKGDEAILRELLNYRPHFTQNNNGESPLDIALKKQSAGTHHNIINILKAYRISIQSPVTVPTPLLKAECPQRYLKTVEETIDQGEHRRRPVTTKKILAQLAHKSKRTGQLKAFLPLGEIHYNLRIAVAKMGIQTKGNVAAVAISFELKIDEPGQKPFFITMPLRIPGKSISKIFNYSDAVRALGSSQLTLLILSHLYAYGKHTLNFNGTHGHQPKYNGDSTDAQYINHSEQPLDAYLATLPAAQMLVNRLIAELRGQDMVPQGKKIKVISVTRHKHGSKLPCGACEYVMVGTQNIYGYPNAAIGLAKNLATVLLETNPHYTFRLQKRAIDIFTTYSADDVDKNHPKLPTAQAANWQQCLPSEIDTRQLKPNSLYTVASSFIYTAFLGGVMHDDELNLADHDISEYTLFSSASDISPDVKKRITKIKDVQEHELNKLREKMEAFSISENYPTKNHISRKLDFSLPPLQVNFTPNIVPFIPNNSTLIPQFSSLYSPPIKEKTKKLYGKLPDQKTTLFFEENFISPIHNDCGFIGIGVTRRELTDFMLAHVEDDKMRKFVAVEIKSALMLGEIKPFNNEWSTLQQALNGLQIEIDGLRRNINHTLLTQKQSALEEVQKKVDIYCSCREMVIYYCKELSGSLALGYNTALWFAKQNNISLYIWHKDESTPNKLHLKEYTEANLEERNVFHLLHTDGFTHFNKLVVTGRRVENDHEISNNNALGM